MSHRKLSGRLPSLTFDYDTMIRNMTTLVRVDEFSFSACWRYLIVSQHSTFTKSTPCSFREATRCCYQSIILSHMHKYEHQKSVNTCRCSLVTILPPPPSFPSHFLLVKVTIIVRDCSISKIIHHTAFLIPKTL